MAGRKEDASGHPSHLGVTVSAKCFETKHGIICYFARVTTPQPGAKGFKARSCCCWECFWSAKSLCLPKQRMCDMFWSRRKLPARKCSLSNRAIRSNGSCWALDGLEVKKNTTVEKYQQLRRWCCYFSCFPVFSWLQVWFSALMKPLG